MICECCRRDVDHVRSSFWHAEARICRECLAQWCDGDNDEIGADAASVGSYVRLRHGLPPLAAVIMLIVLAAAPAAYASRHCLDYSEAGRIWPPRAEVPVAIDSGTDADPVMLQRPVSDSRTGRSTDAPQV
ncbi:MAG TPA: hypothetical protein VGI20_07590 [Rhizomicrobium sp.]